MWVKHTLTTASNMVRVSFIKGGSIYAEGTFGGGEIQVKPVYIDSVTNAPLATTGFLDEAIDGTTVKTKDVPPGHYELDLNGSTGATVDVYTNEQ